MVGNAYMLARDRPATALQRRIDRQLVPALIDAVAPFEQAARVASDAARARPVLALLGAVLVGLLLPRIGRRRR